MSFGFDQSGHLTRVLTSGTAGQYTRVKITSGKWVLAGITDREVGVLTRPALDAVAPVDALLRTAPGTHPFVAAGAITNGALVYTAASGRVSATNGTGSLLVGQALNATSNAGEFVEVLRITATS